MLNKITIRWRLTILSAFLLTICCLGLTIILNFSALNLMDEIDATLITTTANEVYTSKEVMQEMVPGTPSIETQEVKRGFSTQSIYWMLLVIIGGSALTYYIAGKALKPLDILNGQVKNFNVDNLSETLEIPPTKDEIAELTLSFNKMTDKLNSSFMTQKRFSASAAHELRTPLAILQTKVDVFKKKPVHTSDEYEALISIFEKQIHRLRSLIATLLDMTNMDDEREQSTIYFQDMLEEILAELSAIAKNRNISITLLCDDCTMLGNVDLLYRAFYNLIENAIKYNVDNGTIKIEVTKDSNNNIQILIEDSGIGIPDDVKCNIFEPFYRVDISRSREMGGAGLGLSIVESIIKKHGGSITVQSNRNVGSCFNITFSNN